MFEQQNQQNFEQQKQNQVNNHFNKKKIFWGVGLVVLVLVVFCGGLFIGKASTACVNCKQPGMVDFSLFWDAYNKLQDHYINPEKISDEQVLYGAIAGMTQSLGDPYTAFFDPEQAKAFEDDLAGSFDGIGVEVALKKGLLTVVAPLKGTPGDKAGLKPGDIITKIGSKGTQDISTDEAVKLIRGKKGTNVTLTIFREGWKDMKDFVITRDTIKVNSMDWELKDGDVAVIHIHQFDQTLSPDFRKAAFEILESSAKKIIVDLRNNPGGYLETAQDLAGYFLPTGQVVTIEDFGKGKPQHLYKTQGSGTFANYPIVVLINKGSASASEILAGALRDNRGVKLVGEKSFGKGSVQEVVDLDNSQSFLKITIAHWLTPKGASISEVGLSPDVKVDANTDDSKPDYDPVLDKALEIIKGLQ